MAKEKEKQNKTVNRPEVKRDKELAVKIWTNTREKDGQEYKTVTIERTYKDKDDKLQSTRTLRLTDMPRAIILLHEAYKEQMIKTTDNGNGNEEITEESVDL